MSNFVKVTLEDVLNEVQLLRKDISKMQIDIKLNRWIGTTALTVVLSVSFAMIGSAIW